MLMYYQVMILRNQTACTRSSYCSFRIIVVPSAAIILVLTKPKMHAHSAAAPAMSSRPSACLGRNNPPTDILIERKATIEPMMMVSLPYL